MHRLFRALTVLPLWASLLLVQEYTLSIFSMQDACPWVLGNKSKGKIMIDEYNKNLLAAIDASAYSLVETLHTIVAQLAQAELDNTLSTYIGSLLQQQTFTLQQVDDKQHLICGIHSIHETKTLLLFSHCPPQQDALARWGAFVTRLLTFALYHKTIGSIPYNMVWLIDIEEYYENDEELLQWFAKNRTLLRVDCCLYDIPNDDSLPSPCLALGTKGLLRVEIEVETASHDQHILSGAILPDAAWRLTWALNSLKDVREEIHIEDFYDTLVPMEDEEIALLRSMVKAESALKQRLHVNEFLLHLHGFQLYYTYLLLPTCIITRIYSGSTATSSYTLPSFANASIDIHLVPDQEPGDIHEKLRKHLDIQGFQDVSIRVLATRSPQHTPLRNEFAKTVYESAFALYGERLSAFPLMPSQRNYYPFQSLLAIPVVYIQTGYGQSQLYEHDTVTTETNEERQKQILTYGMKHLVAIIERMTHVTDTTQF